MLEVYLHVCFNHRTLLLSFWAHLVLHSYILHDAALDRPYVEALAHNIELLAFQASAHVQVEKVPPNYKLYVVQDVPGYRPNPSAFFYPALVDMSAHESVVKESHHYHQACWIVRDASERR